METETNDTRIAVTQQMPKHYRIKSLMKTIDSMKMEAIKEAARKKRKPRHFITMRITDGILRVVLRVQE